MKGAKFESVIDAGEEDRKKAESSTKVFVGLKAICFALCCVEAIAGTVASWSCDGREKDGADRVIAELPSI